MISSELNQEQQRNLISKIVQYEGKLNAVFEKEPLIFSEITKVFNIAESRDMNDSLSKLKERLVNICLQEKEEYLEYLSLPKFRQISQHALQLLKTALQEISQRIKVEQQNAKFEAMVNGIERYIPKFNSLAEIENYHLRIFELYSKSDICPIGAMQRDLGMMNGEKPQIKEIKSQWGFQNSPYSNFVKSVPHEMEQNYWANQVHDHKIGIEESQRVFQPSFFTGLSKPMSSQILMPPVMSNTSSVVPNQSSTSLRFRGNVQSKISSSHMIEEYSQASTIKREKQQENSRLIEEYSQPLSNISELKHKTINVVDPNFKNCVCKGKIQKAGKEEFVCEFCNGKYHLECLRRSVSSEENKNKKCPICCAQEIQNQCFELVKPPLLSSWAVQNGQNSAQSTIKFTEPMLNQMKKIISRPEHKIYLKLITIKKKVLVHFDQNHDLKANSKQEIGSYEVLGQNDDGIDYEKDSEMVDEGDEAKNSKKRSLKQAESVKGKTSVTQTKNSVEFSPKYITEMLKTSSSNLNLNFPFSPESQEQGKDGIQEEVIIYYGIYEVKRKPLPQILYKVTSQSNLSNSTNCEKSFDEVAIFSVLSNHISGQNYSQIVQEAQNVSEDQFPVKKILFKLLISKKQLRQVAESGQTKQIYPVRFSNCTNITHVFQLENYFETLYNFNSNIKTKQHYNLKKLSPDTQINQCPLCHVAFDSSQDKRRIFLDRKLHFLLNDPKIVNQIVEKYYDTSCGEEENYIEILIEMKHTFDSENQKVASYSYVLGKVQSHRKPEIEEQKSIQGQQKINELQKQRIDGEDCMKNQGQGKEHGQKNQKQDEDDESVIDYGADQDFQNKANQPQEGKNS